MTLDEFQAREGALLHAIQSGVELLIQKGESLATPKHLRVGLNSAMSQHGALVKLMVQKGLLTEEEYFRTCIEMLELEVARVTARVRKVYGHPGINLG